MEQFRYGKFCFRDYFWSWIGIASLLSLSIAIFLLRRPFLLGISPILYAGITLWAIVSPNCERFSINDNVITVKKWWKSQEITIPSDITLVVSYADICPPLARRTPDGNQTHILKNKCAVSILHRMSLETVLECLHRNNMKKYTTSWIEDMFGYQFVYSFVCDNNLLKEMFNKANGQIVIPESLVSRLHIREHELNAYVDVGH